MVTGTATIYESCNNIEQQLASARTVFVIIYMKSIYQQRFDMKKSTCSVKNPTRLCIKVVQSWCFHRSIWCSMNFNFSRGARRCYESLISSCADTCPGSVWGEGFGTLPCLPARFFSPRRGADEKNNGLSSPGSDLARLIVLST